MPLDRRLEAVFQYSEEGLTQCREILSFLKKRAFIEQEYARQLAKLSASVQRHKGGGAAAAATGSDRRASVHTASIWTGFLDTVDETNGIAGVHDKLVRTLDATIVEPLNLHVKEWEATRKALMADGMKATVALQDAYTQLKKAKTDYDDQQRAAEEAEEKSRVARSNPAAKEKDLDKLMTKAQQTEQKAQDARRVWLEREDNSRQSQENFYSSILPELLDKFQSLERDRLTVIREQVSKYYETEQMCVVDLGSHANQMQDKMKAVDVDEDLQDYVNDHIQDEDQGTNVSVRALQNPVRAGRLIRQTSDSFLSPNWKLRYCVLMGGNEQKLYVFDSEAGIKPRHVLNLGAVQTHSVDDSYLDRKSCFQIVMSDYLVKKDNNLVFYLAAENEEDKAAWIKALRANDFSRYLTSMQGVEYRTVKSIKVEVAEAKDLPVGDIIRRSSDPFAIISLGLVRQARTVAKLNTLAPVWGETFFLEDIAHNHRHLVVEICNQNRLGIQRITPLAKLHLALDTLQPNVEQEEWHPLIPPNADLDSGKFTLTTTDLGAVRMKTTLIVEKILPMSEYEPLRQVLFDDNFESMLAVSSVIKNQKEDFAKSILRFSVTQDRQLVVDVLRNLTCQEIYATEDPNIIFRGYSMATKALDYYMKLVGLDYLQTTLKTLVRSVYKDRESCEVDPTRLEKGDDLKRNWRRLLNYVTQFWETIANAADKCPWEIRVVLRNLGEDTMARFNNDKVRQTAITGFIFLRFFCPAILDPKLFGMANEHPDSGTARTFTLIAKTIQNLANLVEFGAKEPYMADMNPFIVRNLDSARNALERFSTPPQTQAPPNPTFDASAIDATREFSAIHRILSTKMDDIIAANEQAPSDALANVIDVVGALDATYDEYDRKVQSGTYMSKPSQQQQQQTTRRGHNRNYSGAGNLVPSPEPQSPVSAAPFAAASGLPVAAAVQMQSPERSKSPTLGSRPVPSIPTTATATAPTTGPSPARPALPPSTARLLRSTDDLNPSSAASSPTTSAPISPLMPPMPSRKLSQKLLEDAIPLQLPPVPQGRRSIVIADINGISDVPTTGPPPITPLARKPTLSDVNNSTTTTTTTSPPIAPQRKPSIHGIDSLPVPTTPVPTSKPAAAPVVEEPSATATAAPVPLARKPSLIVNSNDLPTPSMPPPAKKLVLPTPAPGQRAVGSVFFTQPPQLQQPPQQVDVAVEPSAAVSVPPAKPVRQLPQPPPSDVEPQPQPQSSVPPGKPARQLSTVLSSSPAASTPSTPSLSAADVVDDAAAAAPVPMPKPRVKPGVPLPSQ